MQALRATTASLARCVLAWFALTLAAAVASPMVHADGLQPICGAGAVKFLPVAGDKQAPAPQLTLDCALCTPAIVPPPPVVVAAIASPVQHAQPAFVDRESWKPEPLLRPAARGPPRAA